MYGTSRRSAPPDHHPSVGGERADSRAAVAQLGADPASQASLDSHRELHLQATVDRPGLERSGVALGDPETDTPVRGPDVQPATVPALAFQIHVHPTVGGLRPDIASD